MGLLYNLIIIYSCFEGELHNMISKKYLFLLILFNMSFLYSSDNDIKEKIVLTEKDKDYGKIKEIIRYEDGTTELVFTDNLIKKTGIWKQKLIKYNEKKRLSVEYVDSKHPKYLNSNIDNIATAFENGVKTIETITFTNENVEDKYRQKVKFNHNGAVEIVQIIYFPEYTDIWGIKSSKIEYDDLLQAKEISYKFYNDEIIYFKDNEMKSIMNYSPRLTSYLNREYLLIESNNEINFYYPIENGSTLVQLDSLKIFELNENEIKFFESPNINDINYLKIEVLENNQVACLYIKKDTINEINNKNPDTIFFYYSFVGGLKDTPINIVVDYKL